MERWPFAGSHLIVQVELFPEVIMEGRDLRLKVLIFQGTVSQGLWAEQLAEVADRGLRAKHLPHQRCNCPLHCNQVGQKESQTPKETPSPLFVPPDLQLEVEAWGKFSGKIPAL